MPEKPRPTNVSYGDANGSRIKQDLNGYSRGMSTSSASEDKPVAEAAKPRWKSDRRPHVCVIGAGVAGLRCAEVLLERGVEVTVLEARDRVGGRVHQISQAGHTLDMGANWIHGTSGNPILDIAKETGTTTAEIGEDTTFFNENGSTFDDTEKAQELHDTMWGIISDAFKYSNEQKYIPSHVSLRAFFLKEIEKRELSSADARILMYMAEQWGHFIGASLVAQSLKFFWMEECLEGENLFVASSYKAIIDRIAKRAKAGASFRLSREVTTVGTVLNSDPPVTKVYHRRPEEYPPDNNPGEATTCLECDAVVVTVPLGCLRGIPGQQSKSGKPAIHPQVSQPIQKAVDSLSTGNLEKALVTFSRAWWSPAPSSPGPSFFQFLHPLYDRDNRSQAIIDCMDLAGMPGETSQPTLLFYFSSTFAYELTNALHSAYDSTPTPEQLQDFVVRRFKPYFSLMPGYDPRNAACTPVAATMTSWSHDRFAKGSYTFFSVSDDRDQALDCDVEALRHGMPERGIYFAGEHCAPFVALGTVTGAYWSGERVADRIIESFAEESVAGNGDG